MGKIAITMPGNTGDMLYALPTARVLCAAHYTTCDFYTAETSKHTKALIEYQSFVDKLIIPKSYVIERRDIGTQPWLMPVEDDYDAIYHLGYRSVPDTALHQFIARQIGINIPLAIAYEYPLVNKFRMSSPYICIAPRGHTTFESTFNELADKVNAVIIGGKGDYTGHGVDMTGLNMLDTLDILHYSRGFVGLMSSQLVLANGFDIPRIAIHDGIHWDMRHVVYTARNFYPINPTVAHIIALLDNNT